MTIRLKPKMFSGAANIHNGTLQNILEALAAGQGKQSAATVADLTDNSGGAAANGVIAAIPLPVAAAGPGVTKADAEAALVTVKNALTEIAAKVVAVQAKVPATALTNSIGGSAADGTIAAITKNTANGADTFVRAAGMIGVARIVIDDVATLARQVNALARATGVTPLVDNSGGQALYGAAVTVAALSTDTGTASTGADATTNATVTATTANAFLSAVADAVKELATTLNAITADGTPVPVVVIG